MKKEWNIIGSEVIDYEISKIPDPDKKLKVKKIIPQFNEYIQLDDNLKLRAKEIQLQGIKAYDALHIACGEKAEVDIFLTTDLNIIKKYQNNPNEFKIKIFNPSIWLMEGELMNDNDDTK